jgi:ankyrin repeat protein
MECLFDAGKPHFATWLWIYNEDWRRGSMNTVSPKKPEAFPLYYAAILGFYGLAEHIISKHPDHVNAKGGREVTPVHVAASAGHDDILSLLLEHGANLEGKGINDQRPLHRASMEGALKAGKCLLDRGANINARNDKGWTPLYHAAYFGQVGSTQLLLEHGASVDAQTSDGETPLHGAVKDESKIHTARLLLEDGADVNARDNSGRTPFQLTSSSDQEVRHLLSEYGAESLEYAESVYVESAE